MPDKKKFEVEVNLTINEFLTIESETMQTAEDDVQKLDFDTLTCRIYPGGQACLTNVQVIDVLESEDDE
jgi:formyltetrahydrofolate synthetase